MPTDDEKDLLDPTPDSDADPDKGAGDEDEKDTDKTPDEMATLRTEVALLRAQNAKTANEVKAAIGRYQALLTAADAGREVSTTQSKRLEGAVGAVENALDALLDDESITPEVKTRVRAARAEARAKADTSAMREEIEALKKAPVRREPEPAADDELAPIEKTVHALIRRAGMKIEDFDWAAASAIYSTKGDDGVIDHFMTLIDTKRAETEATGRRQARKTNAGTEPPEGTGTASNIDALLTQYSADPATLTPANRAIAEKYMSRAGVLS